MLRMQPRIQISLRFKDNAQISFFNASFKKTFSSKLIEGFESNFFLENQIFSLNYQNH